MGSNLITPNLAINVVKKISLAQPLRLPRVCSLEKTQEEEFALNTSQPSDYVDVMPPTSASSTDTLKIRILSYEMLNGMVRDLPHYQNLPLGCI